MLCPSAMYACRPFRDNDRVAGFVQAPMEPGHEMCEGGGRGAVEKTDNWSRLLCARRKRPSCRCAADKCDELAPLHVGHQDSSRLGVGSRSIARSTCRRGAGKSLGLTSI